MGKAGESEPHTRLREGVEFDVVREFLARWRERASGIGDDAAVIDAPRDGHLVATTDTTVENVHFRREWLTPREIGYRAAASSLSDLAAMAADPIGILCAVTLSAAWLDDAEQIADGLGDAARTSRTVILGGDLSSGSELSVTVTALGAARQPLLRSGARHGDSVYVTGALGAPGAAVRNLLSGKPPERSHRDRFVCPVPRIEEARWLADHGATACIDISDGLVADLGHVAVASGVMITLDLESVPAIDGVSQLDAASSGEEYELAVTTPGTFDTEEFQTAFGIELTRIGKVGRGTPSVILLERGVRIEPAAGYLHFSK